MNAFIGKQIGNYKIIRMLGSGGFADVYLGEHSYLNTQAAIKMLQTRLASEQVQPFLNEARTVANLSHPHIVKVLDFGIDTESKYPYLVMTYAPNGTLRQRHPHGTRLSPTEVLSYLRQLGPALQYAHERKLIHRDIKPENMLIGADGSILLGDFGIAVATQSSRYQGKQEVGGTVAYMAPEQIQGKAVAASDQYALAIVVYEWLVGQRPFTGSFAEIGSQHLFTAPPSIREKVPEITPQIEAVVLKALSKKPEDRYPSIQAFVSAFEKAYQESQSAPLPPPPKDVSGETTHMPQDANKTPQLSESQIPTARAQFTPSSPEQPPVGVTSGASHVMTNPNLSQIPTSRPLMTPTPSGSQLSGYYPVPPAAASAPPAPKQKSRAGLILTIVILILLLLGTLGGGGYLLWQMNNQIVALSKDRAANTQPTQPQSTQPIVTAPTATPSPTNETSGSAAATVTTTPEVTPTGGQIIIYNVADIKKFRFTCALSCDYNALDIVLDSITVNDEERTSTWHFTITNGSHQACEYMRAYKLYLTDESGKSYSSSGPFTEAILLNGDQTMERWASVKLGSEKNTVYQVHFEDTCFSFGSNKVYQIENFRI
ncbi:serine/threonine-protein kinase [Thermosporothrix hazakensis]|jgi:serine/threonine protein kinase|uniref:Serine/threonine-protein kinase n=1 Tax=Thermosporothrix hazakensis TaxID=644383 RepID=A0A326UUF7_THEHA|nr:serine/threonine-protein kinase [Thermosporothrix hazakensis]PZW36253.1 serine/threonine-protein kinase [Thermosporothrix hazakensis]GCE46902.1 hypothetical protein KTH_17710 [Thermosporothrix hazakensis]